MTPLKYTLEQARDRAIASIGIRRVPNPWWPSDYKQPQLDNNDCIKACLYWVGAARRQDQDHRYISIEGFIESSGWNRVAPDDIRPGDIAVEGFAKDNAGTYLGIIEHAELVYSIDRDAGTITTITANAAPIGVEMTDTNRGVYKKTRELRGWLLFGVRPPYKGAAATTTSKERARVRRIASWLNTHVNSLEPTAAEQDGIPGPNYYLHAQEWGSTHDEHGAPVARSKALYGATFMKDGVRGPRTDYVLTVIDRLSK